MRDIVSYWEDDVVLVLAEAEEVYRKRNSPWTTPYLLTLSLAYELGYIANDQPWRFCATSPWKSGFDTNDHVLPQKQ